MNNGVFSESNVNSFSSHSAQYKYSMPAGKDYVTMKMYCIVDQHQEAFKATKPVIESGDGC
jgi:hypothetical protein